MKNRIVSIIFGILVFLCILSCSIALPILFRPFYYALIKPIVIPSGSQSYYWDPSWTYKDVKQAYDEILDFCVLPWDNTFSAGVFSFTEDAATHFADCKVLFYVDFIVSLLSISGIGIIHILKKKKLVELKPLWGRSPSFYGACLSVVLPLFIISVVAIIGFDKVFEAFHKIFFPGKVWQFADYEDGFILIMPEEFFAGCCIVIGSSLVISASTIMTLDIVRSIKKKKGETR